MLLFFPLAPKPRNGDNLPMNHPAVPTTDAQRGAPNRRLALRWGSWPFYAFGLIILLSAIPASAAALLDDRAVTIASTQDIVTKRRALVQYLWGSDGFP